MAELLRILLPLCATTLQLTHPCTQKLAKKTIRFGPGLGDDLLGGIGHPNHGHHGQRINFSALTTAAKYTVSCEKIVKKIGNDNGKRRLDPQTLSSTGGEIP